MRKVLFAIAMALVLLPSVSFAQTAKEKEAKVIDLTNKGIEYVAANGLQKAVATFSDPKGGFIEGEFYLFIYDLEGNAQVVGGNPSLNGKNLLGLFSQDRSGKKVYQIKELLDIVKAKGEGWLEFSWQNPKTKKFGPKKAYAKKVAFGGKPYMIGSGYYLGDQD